MIEDCLKCVSTVAIEIGQWLFVTAIWSTFVFILSHLWNKRSENKVETPDESDTPPRAQLRDGTKENKVPNVRVSDSSLPSRLPKSFPLMRNASQIDLLGSRSNYCTPLRPQAVTRRTRASTPNLRDVENVVSDISRKDSLLNLRAIPLNRCSCSSFDFHSAAEENLHMPSNDNLNSKHSLKTNKSTSGSNSHSFTGNLMEDNRHDLTFLESFNMRSKCSSQDFRHLPAQKRSVEFPSVPENRRQRHLNDSSECEDVTIRRLQLRNNHYSTPGPFHRSLPNNFCTKIPIRKTTTSASLKAAELMNFHERHRGIHTVGATTKNPESMYGFQKKGDMTCLKLNDINSWITFRIDTSEKFERVFKFQSKRKHHSTGNIIDANLHAQWITMAGITADKDAHMFRNYAGRKVVLTLSEYKFLLYKISLLYDLDYWDVLRKMATFREEEEFLHEE